MNAVGIVAGLTTAVLWTVTAICFESAARRIGSFAVNLLRLLVAAMLFIGLSLARSGHPGPDHLPAAAWCDLGLSGFVGFALADLMLFRACVLMGARTTMLIYASVPAITGVAGYAFLGERVSVTAMCGMAITSAGICLAVIGKRSSAERDRLPTREGILLAIGASAGQAAGLLLGKHGAGQMDAFSATEIRILAGLAGFFLISGVSGQLPQLRTIVTTAAGVHEGNAPPTATSTRVALLLLTVGAVLGPFLGVSLGLLSTQLLAAGIASTLMSLVPALLIPVSAIVFRERVTITEVAGALIALAGVALLV